ncbi:MAG: FkbM family methyltransferase [Acutalibacteraceae bacterium]
MERDLWLYLKTAKKPIVLYGMGNGADKIIKVLSDYGISPAGVFASDGFVRDKYFHNMKIESYREIKKRLGQMIVLLCFGTARTEVIENIKSISGEQELYAPDVPVIGDGLFNLFYYEKNRTAFDDIYSLLADQKSKHTFENVIKYKISGKIEYLFDCEANKNEPYESFFEKRANEHFLDLGAYNGDTVLDFIKRNPDHKKITAVEPDRKNFKKLILNTSKYENINCFNLCVSDFDGKGGFSACAGRNSAASKTGAETDFSTVDTLLADEDATLIKMDIEGEEKRAIMGAYKTIKLHKPRMIISCYHRTEDLLSIPQAVFSIRQDYRIYMRHFAYLPAWDTVYYFV